MTHARIPLLWTVFAGNAVVLAAATLVLVISPATVSFPAAERELIVLVAGLALMLSVNLLLLRRAFGPLAGLPADELLARVEAQGRELARRTLAAQERERIRIARELHDEVGQTLTAVLWQLERGELAEAGEGVRGAVEEVREIARRLRPEALDDLGLHSALAALTVRIQQSSGVRVERAIEPSELTSEQELVVYRVTQEALTNVARHSGARTAEVRLARRGRSLVLEVADDGCGFDGPAAGTGLRGMRERAALVGAALEVQSRPGAGTTVRLVL